MSLKSFFMNVAPAGMVLGGGVAIPSALSGSIQALSGNLSVLGIAAAATAVFAGSVYAYRWAAAPRSTINKDTEISGFTGPRPSY